MREDLDLPELRVVRALLLRVVTRVSSTSRERKESREMVSTTSRERGESSSIPTTEKTVLAEAEASPRAVTARATGAPLRMRLRSLLRKELKTPPPISQLLRSPRLRKSLRRGRKLQLRLESLLRTILTLRNSLSLSTWLRKRSQLSRRKAEATRTTLPRRLVSRLFRPPETELRPLLTPLGIRKSTILLSARVSSLTSFLSRLRRITSSSREVKEVTEVTEVIDAVAVVAAVVAVLPVAPELVVETTIAEVPESRNSELMTSLPSSENLKE